MYSASLYLQDEEMEDDETNDLDEEKKVGERPQQRNDPAEDSNQIFNEFSKWRSNQAQGKGEPKSKQSTEMAEIQVKGSQKKSMISMSENEIDQQRNKITEDDDLFKGFSNSNKE